MICKSCNHLPSCRFGNHFASWKCRCKCHDAADAAPDLLEACKAVLSSPKYGNEPSDEAIEMVEDAIAKAEGGGR